LGFALIDPNDGLNIQALKSQAGKVDGGWKLNGSKLHMTNALGMAQAEFYAARAYADERIVANRRIGDGQAVNHRPADTSAKIKSAKGFVYQGAWRVDQVTVDNATAARVKIVATETAVQLGERVTRIRGEAGITREYPVGRTHHDTFVYVIGEATSDVQRNLIARDLEYKS